MSKKIKRLHFEKQQGREIIADFSGGMITSNAGILLIAELDKRLKITESFAECFRDYRHREKWPNTQILVRADSAYAREEIFAFCESQAHVDYVIAMSTNNQLKMRASDVVSKAKKDYQPFGQGRRQRAEGRRLIYR